MRFGENIQIRQADDDALVFVPLKKKYESVSPYPDSRAQEKSPILKKALSKINNAFNVFREQKAITPRVPKNMQEDKKGITRRGLLKGTAVAAVALAGAKAYDSINDNLGLLENLKNNETDSGTDNISIEEESGELTQENISNREEIKTEPEEAKSETEIRNAANHFLSAHRTLKERSDFFPPHIFTKDLLIAQEIQESGGDIEARSPKNAYGLRQTMPIAVKDLSLFLERLHENKVIKYDGPIYIGDKKKQLTLLEKELAGTASRKNFRERARREELREKISTLKQEIATKKARYGKRILSDVDLISIENLATHYKEHSHALGDLFLMRLYHKSYGLGAGHKYFNNIRGAQTEILAAYNAGYEQIKDKKPEKWPAETKTYTKRIFNLMERLDIIRRRMREQGLDPKNDAIARRIALEMDKVQIVGEKREDALARVRDHLIKKIKDINITKNSPITEADLDRLAKELSNTKSISLNNLESYLQNKTT